MRLIRSEIIWNVLRDHFRQASDSRLSIIVEHLQGNLGNGKRNFQIPPTLEEEIIMPTTLLFVDDNINLVQMATRYMGDIRPQWRFLLAHSLAEARQVYNQYTPDAAVLDVGLPDGNGLDLLLELKRRHPRLPVIMISGDDPEPLRQEVIDRGGYSFLGKPFSAPLLVDQIELAISSSRDESLVPVFPQPEASGAGSNPHALVLRPADQKIEVYATGAVTGKSLLWK